MSEVLLQTVNLKKYFPLRNNRILKAVDGVSISISRGETLGIVGESGCGKSTLGRTIIRLYDPTEGNIKLAGKDISGKNSRQLRRELAQKMQMVFQDPFSSLNSRMTVLDIIAEGWDISHMKVRAEERRERVYELLHIVGLSREHAGRFPHEFSGGQRQRIGIARALAMDPELMICDEPMSALDVSIQAQIMNLLVKLQQERELAYLFIAHDLSMVRYLSDQVGVMYLGELVEYAASSELYAHPLHPYTQALFSAAPVANPGVEKSRRRIELTGEAPSPIHAPAGCKFSTRCPRACDICRHEAPTLREAVSGHQVACHQI